MAIFNQDLNENVSKVANIQVNFKDTALNAKTRLSTAQQPLIGHNM